MDEIDHHMGGGPKIYIIIKVNANSLDIPAPQGQSRIKTRGKRLKAKKEVKIGETISAV